MQSIAVSVWSPRYRLASLSFKVESDKPINTTSWMFLGPRVGLSAHFACFGARGPRNDGGFGFGMYEVMMGLEEMRGGDWLGWLVDLE